MRGQDTAVVACAGQRIGVITVRSFAPTAAAFRRIGILAHVVSTIHTTTNPEVIQRFLLLHSGDACSELRRAESERILRAQPFIAEAQVRAIANAEGGVDLDVRTTDEIALVLSGAAANASPAVRYLRLGDANIAGEGVYAAADWRAGGAFRDGFGGRVVDNQLLGKPYTLTADAYRDPLGSRWRTDVAYPYYTDIQRLAWLARSGADDQYVQFRNDAVSSHALRVVRNYFDVGGIARVGAPGKLSLFGLSISGDDERPGTTQRLVTDSGFAPDASTLLLNRYEHHHIARINALLGVRDIEFVRVRGYDALSATQDMPVGFQLGTLIGRSAAMLGSSDNDTFLAGDFYAGAVGRDNAVRFQLEAEGRRNDDTGQWDGLLTTGRMLEYLKPSPYNTIAASAEFSGGWRQRLPFNLRLSDREGGLRGFASSDTPGAQRAVVRLEDREFIGQPYGLVDFGLGFFAEAGKLWAGDIPYGVTTPVRASAGISLLATVPPGSARLWRIDLAIAANPEVGGHRLELRMSSTDKTTFFLAEPYDIQMIREPTVPASIFRWPQ